MKWLEITVSVEPADIDAVCYLYDMMGTGGVSIEDPAIIYNIVANGNNETVAFEKLPPVGSLPVIKGYLSEDSLLSNKLDEFRKALARINTTYTDSIALKEIEESSWLDKWKEYYKPLKLGKNLLIRPSWLQGVEEDDLTVIEMDPGMAFGCGNHPTTSMCAEILEEIVKGDEKVVDVGTGSGILSIIVAKLGASQVLAVDVDPLAVRVARENILSNGLAGRINVQENDMLKGITFKSDIIVANIVADVIIKLLPSVVPLLKDGGKFIASGIILNRREEVAQAITDSGLQIAKILSQGEWTAFLATA